MPLLLAVLAGFLVAICPASVVAQTLTPSWLLLIDQEWDVFVDPGTGEEFPWAGVLQVDPDVDAAQDPDPNEWSLLFDGPNELPRAWGVWPISLSEVLIVDANADPAGLGDDLNPENSDPGTAPSGGHGALWRVDVTTGDFTLVSDGTFMTGGLPPGVPSAFTGPRDVMMLPDGTALVVDPDSDAAGLGFDPGRENLDTSLVPHAGYGALLRVNLSTGEVSILSDGTIFSGTKPDVDGDTAPEPSVFVDPWSVTQDPNDPDHVLLFDASADALERGNELGAVFRVNLETGAVDHVASDSDWFVPFDLVWHEPSDTVLVLDLVGEPFTPKPKIFRVDGTSSSVWAEPTNFEYPVGMFTNENDDVFVVDSDVDPHNYGFPIGPGAIFRVTESAATAEVIHSNPNTFFIADGAEVPTNFPPTLDPLTVTVFCSGAQATLNLTGTGFAPDAAVTATGGIAVSNVVWNNAQSMMADIDIPCGTLEGTQDILVRNPSSGLFATTELYVDPGFADPGPPVSAVGDTNSDRYIDGVDLAEIGLSFGTAACCDPGFSNDADLNDDGVVDGTDLGIFATSFGLILD